jgi:integrase/recombinase XerD
VPKASVSSLYLDQFIEMLASERGSAQNTLESYRRDLLDCAAFLGPLSVSLEKADTTTLRAYLTALHDRGMTSSSIARHLSALKQFFQFLITEGVRSEDPTSLLSRPKKAKPLPKILTEEEVTRLLETVSQDNSPEGQRLEALLEILYASGLRVSELISLTHDAILQAEQTLIVRGKGEKERLVPLSSYALGALEKYLRVRHDFIAHPSGVSKWLFPSYGKSGHLTRQRFGQLLKDLALQAGIDPEKVSPHVIRHAFATHLLNGGADLVSVQNMLGHADIATTQIYTHVMHQKLQDVIQQCHPLSQKKKIRCIE